MKNVLLTENDGTFSLLNTVDDGTNTLVFNDTIIPTTEWVGEGTYTTTVGSVEYSITKAPDQNGNYQLIQDTLTTYHFARQMSAEEKMIDAVWPVGSYYITSDVGFDPNDEWVGTWELESEGNFLEATKDSTKVGTTVDAGLPNITGSVKTGWVDNSGGGIIIPNGSASYEGAFGLAHVGTAWWTPGTNSSTSDYHANQITIDASKSSAVYGGSDTVQPAARKVFMWHRVR